MGALFHSLQVFAILAEISSVRGEVFLGVRTGVGSDSVS